MGYQVTVLNRGTRPNPFANRVERITVDRTSAAFKQAIGGRSFDAVVDFAAYKAEDVEQVLEAFSADSIGHYIFISTGQVYLVRNNCPLPARESDYDGPVMAAPSTPDDHDEWLYGIRKRAAEDVLVQAWERQRFPSTRLRIPMVNGERDFHRRLESYLWRILDGGPVLLPGYGTKRVRHVYSMAIVRFIADIVGNQAVYGRAYNLCQDEIPTVSEFIHLLADAVGAPAQIVGVDDAILTESGLSAQSISPFHTTWTSLLEPSRAKLELGFVHELLPRYIERIVTSMMNHLPSQPPDNYVTRAKELEIAKRCRVTSST